jgi:putative ABC transport system substrate-binding protein
MTANMKRRELIMLLGSAAAAAAVVRSLAARAQTPAIIGMMTMAAPTSIPQPLASFRAGLMQSGFVEGQNVKIEYRSAEGQFDRIPAFIADLVRRQPSLLMLASPTAVLAAKRVTATIPIVFVSGDDPVKRGLIASLNRPGGNITGVYQFSYLLEAKRLALLHDMLPKVGTIAAIIDPSNPAAETQIHDVQKAAEQLGVHLVVLTAHVESDFVTTFASLAQQQAGALLVAAGPFFNSRRQQLIALAARHAVPTIYPSREFAEAGGLMSYGSSFTDMHRQAGTYTGRILKGEKPADLPVMQPTMFEFVINLQTAQALDIDVPPTLLARADEVIE